mmetsp:Transcript_12022/g.22348  ORF Transcript_12022/g.22348 Transcript_12022/m.22348 type:complete len:409 (-) Transcript_12022:326-1552(-)
MMVDPARSRARRTPRRRSADGPRGRRINSRCVVNIDWLKPWGRALEGLRRGARSLLCLLLEEDDSVSVDIGWTMKDLVMSLGRICCDLVPMGGGEADRCFCCCNVPGNSSSSETSSVMSPVLHRLKVGLLLSGGCTNLPPPPTPAPPVPLPSLIVLNESAKLSKFIFDLDTADALKSSSRDCISDISDDDAESSEKSVESESSIMIESRMESQSAERVERRLDRSPVLVPEPPMLPMAERERPDRRPPLPWLLRLPIFVVVDGTTLLFLSSAKETNETGLLFDDVVVVSFVSSLMGSTLKGSLPRSMLLSVLLRLGPPPPPPPLLGIILFLNFSATITSPNASFHFDLTICVLSGLAMSVTNTKSITNLRNLKKSSFPSMTARIGCATGPPGGFFSPTCGKSTSRSSL